MTVDREQQLVELVTLSGEAIGTSTVLHAHTAPGSLHRAFSVLLFDDEGRTLLQQRAAEKTRFPLRWANACCGHPAPGERVTTAAARRLIEELGVTSVGLVEAGVYTYKASDPATGRVEYEYDHVLVGRVRADLPMTADRSEVAAVRWVPRQELDPGKELDPNELDPSEGDYAPWLRGVLNVVWTSNVLTNLSNHPDGRQ